MSKPIYEDLKKDVTTVLNALTNFFKLPEQEGFIVELSKYDNHIDFKVADDKFSIYWFYDVRTRQAYAKTLHYVFELKSDGNFFQPGILRSCDLLFTAEGVQIAGSKFSPYSYDSNSLHVMFQQYFSILKTYLGNYHSAQIRNINPSEQGFNLQTFQGMTRNS